MAGLVMLANALEVPYPVVLVLGARPGVRARPAHVELPPGLVLLTTFTVAAVAHWAGGLPWAAAFVLGAVVSPTDVVSATATASRLLLTHRIVTISKGRPGQRRHGAGRVPRGGRRDGAFWPAGAAPEFLPCGTGGALIGLVVGWAISRLRRRTEDALVEVAVSLFAPYAPTSWRKKSAPRACSPLSPPASASAGTHRR